MFPGLDVHQPVHAVHTGVPADRAGLVAGAAFSAVTTGLSRETQSTTVRAHRLHADAAILLGGGFLSWKRVPI